jgi:hypothetical protein
MYSMLGLRACALPHKSLRASGAFGEENLSGKPQECKEVRSLKQILDCSDAPSSIPSTSSLPARPPRSRLGSSPISCLRRIPFSRCLISSLVMEREYEGMASRAQHVSQGVNVSVVEQLEPVLGWLVSEAPLLLSLYLSSR